MAKGSDYINRELSWLEFNQRVLDEAKDESVPLLERLNFLAISASNMDEFFMVRVGGLELVMDAQGMKKDASGMTPAQQLESIGIRTRKMIESQYSCYCSSIEPELAKAGIKIIRDSSFTEEQSQHIEKYFNEELFPVVTPMAVGQAEGFPLLINLGMNVAVRIKPDADDQKQLYAVIPLGNIIRRFIAVPAESGFAYVPVEIIIQRYLDRYFPGKTILESITFRVTRNADFAINEELTTDFLTEMERLISKRKEEKCIRLEFDRQPSKTLEGFLVSMLKVNKDNIFHVEGPIDLADFRELTGLEGFQNIKYDVWRPNASPDIDLKKSIFDEIKRKDLIFYHPYESFEPVIRLLQEASTDPNVLAIKQTLYRVSSNSPVIAALQQAVKRGKYVTVLVELKARFDEERNIEWAKSLERNGAQVIYGVKGLKTHSKICIVVRKEPQGIVRYMHFGTGNYNERTASIYTDAGLLTCNPDLGADASAFFNMITGYSEPQKFLKLYSAPIGMREKLISMIQGETERKKEGQKAVIMAKMNSLVDTDIIDELYEASKAGVKIMLNVRGICCLRPGVKDLSENISVVSIVDRYLEHSRIFYFYEGGTEAVYISSADWMPRNLDKRIELMVPVEDNACKTRLISILDACFKDTAKARKLMPDGTYERMFTGKKKEFRCQEYLYRESSERMRKADIADKPTFELHKPPSE